MTLKPCPFCGTVKIELLREPTMAQIYPPLFSYTARCPRCGVELLPFMSKAEAIAAWNRRTPDWERRYGELVETVAKRTDQAKGAK